MSAITFQDHTIGKITDAELYRTGREFTANRPPRRDGVIWYRLQPEAPGVATLGRWELRRGEAPIFHRQIVIVRRLYLDRRDYQRRISRPWPEPSAEPEISGTFREDDGRIVGPQRALAEALAERVRWRESHRRIVDLYASRTRRARA